jgi:F-type H+-transporting ATPase subunit b
MLHSETFWVALSFLIFAYVAYKPAQKMLFQTLDGRAERIRAELDEAEKLRRDAEATLAAYKSREQEALKEAQAIVAQAHRDADALRERAAAELDSALKRREAQAIDRIRQAEAAALAEVRNLAVDIAITASGRLLQDKLAGAPGDHLIDAAIADLGKSFA